MLNRLKNSMPMFCLLAILFLNACQTEVQSDLVQAKKLKTIGDYNDKDFVINVVDIKAVGDEVYLLEEGLSKIVRTQPELDNFELFGDRGMGPQEIISPALMNVLSKDTLLVYDKQKFKFYTYNRNDGNVKDGIAFNRMLLNNTLLTSDSIVYFTSPVQKKYDIERFDFKNGKALEGIDLPETASKSIMGRNLFEFEGGYLLVGGFSPPFIETYNSDWELLNSTKLIDKNEAIKKLLRDDPTLDLMGNLKVEKGQINVRASGRLVVRSARLVNNELFLLTYYKHPDNINRSNVIYRYAYENDSWALKASIGLTENSSYKTFHVNDDKQQIIAFDEVSTKLELFEISMKP